MTAAVQPSLLHSVVCLTGQRRQDLAVAEAARAGRFTHAGLTLTLGRRPDWLHAGQADDEEWRIEWVKLYEGLDLAQAFVHTGEPGFLRTWEDLVESFCDQVPADYDSTDVTARRLQNWLYAWQGFATAPAYDGLRPGLADRLLRRIDADALHIAEHLTTERNHRTLELYSLFLVGLALGDDARAEQALALLTDNACTDIWDDGVHRECSTDYHMIVLRSLVGAVANARAAGLSVPDALLDRVHRGCDVALHVQRPDGITPALSDGDPDDFRDLLATAADLLDRPDLAWAASRGTTGMPPRDRSVSFPVGGYHVQRSGWGDRGRGYAEERFGVFDCGPLGDGGHGHYDQLSVELYGAGSPLVVDPGRYTYADNCLRHWFKGTAGHNTVCVDDLDQTPYRPGKPRGQVSTARLLGRWTGPGLDVLCGRVSSPAYDAVHTRTVAFVRDDYWIVHDRLRAATPHRYAAHWHLGADAEGSTTLHAEPAQTVVRAPAGPLVVPAGFGAVALTGGWVSPEYGVKLPAPIVAVRADGRGDADIVTVLLPGTELADVVATRSGAQTEVRVSRPDGTDVVRLSDCAPELSSC
ncbi:MAG: alginate lyase family protein [Geodermatophilaceae bacterium]